MRLLKFIISYTGIAFAAFFLQTTLMSRISLAGIAPNLLVVVCAVASAAGDSRKGILMGFLCGIWCDIFFGTYFGLYALIYMTTAFAAGTMRRLIFDDDVNLPVLIIILADMVYGLISYFLFYFMRTRFQFFWYLGHIILPEAVYTAIIGIVVYRLFLLIQKRIDLIEKRSADKFV